MKKLNVLVMGLLLPLVAAANPADTASSSCSHVFTIVNGLSHCSYVLSFPAHPIASPRCWSVIMKMICGCFSAIACCGRQKGTASPDNQ